jgi:hypothetical protein
VKSLGESEREGEERVSERLNGRERERERKVASAVTSLQSSSAPARRTAECRIASAAVCRHLDFKSTNRRGFKIKHSSLKNSTEYFVEGSIFQLHFNF